MEEHILKAWITRFPKALRQLARLRDRKIETLTLAALAAGSAVGIARTDGPASSVAAITTRAATAVVSVAPASAAKKAATGGATAKSANKKSTDLAMIDHPRVESWIKRFTTDLRGSMATSLARMTRYQGMISSELSDRHMPQSLIYLAMIESNFNPKARSPVRASGLWQFMSATAKRFGLRVNRRVDERNNPSKATEAALRYLSYLHNKFGSWYLAAAAYNGGEGTVSKAMKRVTGRTKGTDADFYRISSHLPKETRDYVPKLIAAARIGQNPARYGFDAN